jgi:tRNA A37 methylthiotransferase MiaB
MYPKKSHKITGNCRLATKTRLVALEQFIGQIVEVLVKKKKSTEEFSGRNSQSITVVFKENYKIGDFVNVKITSCTSGTLKGKQ